MTEVNRRNSQADSDDEAVVSCLGNVLSKSLESLKSVQTFHCNYVDHEVLMTPSGSQQRVTNGSWGHLVKLGRKIWAAKGEA